MTTHTTKPGALARFGRVTVYGAERSTVTIPTIGESVKMPKHHADAISALIARAETAERDVAANAAAYNNALARAERAEAALRLAQEVMASAFASPRLDGAIDLALDLDRALRSASAALAAAERGSK